MSFRINENWSIKKLKQALPITPNKRAAVLSAYVDCNRILKSPGVKKFHDSFEESVEKMAIRNIQDVITSVKHKRNGEAKAALNILTSSVSGENISDRKRATKSLANILGVNSRTLQKGKKNRTKVLHSEHSSFLYTTRKTRSDALTERTKRIVHDFWLQSNVSRPTNNKNDIKRVRISPNVYSSHSCYILEKTQTEIFLQFKNEYPDEKIGQRAFEKCKPYFVRTAQFKDKVTCCCRQHVEMRSLLNHVCNFVKDYCPGKEAVRYAKILRNYFETSHARGPQDAAGGFIKKQADLAVIRDSVNRDRDRNFLPVKENRKIHQVRSFDDGEIFVRKLSCYSCQSCIVGNYSTCMNDAQLGTYNKIKMVKESEHNDSDADSNNDEGVDDETNICDFVSNGTIFAVKADDTDCPYYILRASKDPIILRKTATDKWGASYHQGNKVIHGYYFNTIDNNPFKLKLLKRIPAIVPALSVIYICSEVDIDDNGLINLNESLHGRILRCLDHE
ncbi:unnamed protein product [Mytilus edulis]|uniref:Uncharacterized protein n=1 Tax=Mytilus edulis TaxID=6550 RepID=A0A8S3T8I5_MYTED|nr:unnamed protein product [Mytilus edulis]